VRDFPTASWRERKIPIISDEILEFYAFLFCQGSYDSLGMTFEHFLLVLTSVRLDIAFRNYAASERLAKGRDRLISAKAPRIDV
jgi:hypothetical protein